MGGVDFDDVGLGVLAELKPASSALQDAAGGITWSAITIQRSRGWRIARRSAWHFLPILGSAVVEEVSCWDN